MTDTLTDIVPNRGDTNPTSTLRQEYETQQAHYYAQPPMVQRFLEAQGRNLAEAISQRLSQVRFTLPDKVNGALEQNGGSEILTVPTEQREQLAGGLIERITGAELESGLNLRLTDLEQHPDKAVAVSAALIRYATAMHMIYRMLPSGRSVEYTAVDGEEIPSVPVGGELDPQSAITATTDAIAEEGLDDLGRGELLVPYVPAARQFYLPQWVAFDDQDRLLVNSINEAEGHVASMQRFISILHKAVILAPFVVADQEYQQKRYGMLGQLVNQGKALARYKVKEIISIIKRRAAAQDLNRGLSLSLPYFDDQELSIKTHAFEIIPAGRIMFVPAFVVRASKLEQAKIVQETRLNVSTRRHLLTELKTLENAFDNWVTS